MKINIKKLAGIFVLATMLYSCDTTNESGYIPAVYTTPTSFTIVEDAASATDNSFVITYTPSSVGKGYYVVLPTGSPAPTSTNVHSGGANYQQAGSFDVDGSTPVNITVNNKIFGSYSYDVYAIHKSEDNFISETVTKLSVTTPDTMVPTFDRPNTSPGHNEQPGTNSPFRTIDLAFSEPVFYQGGDVTFTGFFSGRTITVNGASAFSSSGTMVSIADHGTFAPDDAILVTWGADTFKDKSGKSVDPLTGFGYYFWTRAFTNAEKAKLSPGMYNYSTVFYGGLTGFYSGLFAGNPGVFLPDTGTFQITADANDAMTLRGINLMSGFITLGLAAESETLPIVYSATTDDELDVMPNASSAITVGGAATHWAHYSASIFGVVLNSPGSYDFDAGTITHWVSLYRTVDDAKIDDIDYLYTRIGTYTRSKDAKSMSMDELRQLSKSTKKVVKNDFKGTLGY